MNTPPVKTNLAAILRDAQSMRDVLLEKFGQNRVMNYRISRRKIPLIRFDYFEICPACATVTLWDGSQIGNNVVYKSKVLKGGKNARCITRCSKCFPVDKSPFIN